MWVVPLLLLFSLGLAGPARGQLLREFRGAWVATVSGIDFPKEPGRDPESLRRQWTDLLDLLDQTGMNAVIVQVRPAGDAFYPSAHAPWSAYLTGKQGVAPREGFDPLAFMIEETHRRSMEFHAWLNPYRLSTHLDTFSLHPDHLFFQHREWVWTYDGKLYLNPALPEVRRHIADVAEELVRTYEVDAIHFDDYFYPFTSSGPPLQDSVFYLASDTAESLQAWRRRQVSEMIREVYQRIREVKPWVRFGVSPFGVWRNRGSDPLGSPTQAGMTCYDDLFADVLQWARLGWVDYLMPQLYWSIGFPLADYALLHDWWDTRLFGPHFIVGHAAYKVGADKDSTWLDPRELPNQIRLRRTHGRSGGSCFYNASSLQRNALGLRDSLRQLFSRPALLPVWNAYAESPPAAPHLHKPQKEGGFARLRWDPSPLPDWSQPYYYALFRCPGEMSAWTPSEAELVYLSPFQPEERDRTYLDKDLQAGDRYTYFVIAYNRNHQGSRTSNAFGIRKKKRGMVRKKP